jgi:hypothetical protein
MISALTCTGDRPRPFALCVEYMARQSCKPDQWIIVDDGKAPMVHEARRLSVHCAIPDVQIIRREPQRSDPLHTLSVNLLAGLDRVSWDVVFIEDDDWYSPDHVQYVDQGLTSADLFGFRGIVYYHVVKRYYRLMGADSPHSSLCQTGARRSVFPLLKKICANIIDKRVRDSGFIDLQLWREFTGVKLLAKNRSSVVGIKGLPGRVGLTAGWRSVSGYRPDPTLNFLESLIGSDVEHYRQLDGFHNNSGRTLHISRPAQ